VWFEVSGLLGRVLVDGGGSEQLDIGVWLFSCKEDSRRDGRCEIGKGGVLTRRWSV
jgi:hypothetical protein